MEDISNQEYEYTKASDIWNTAIETKELAIDYRLMPGVI